MTQQHLNARVALILCAACWSCLASRASAALKLVETVAGFDFNVGQSPIELEVPFTTTNGVYGVGLTARWTAVIADEGGGMYPWSTDTTVSVLAPDGATQLSWPMIGGDVTIADYPLQDAAGGFTNVAGNGTFTWTFSMPGVPEPYTMGLRNVSYHLLTNAHDEVRLWTGTTDGGPLWDRPYFIGGISSQGPVSHHAMQFTVAVPGKYSFLSEVNDSVNFTFLYQGGFDANQPLVNLLDYGLGNGNAPNGTPPGTSLIDELLLETTTYTYVTSQWASFTSALPFTTTVTGPGEIVAVCTTCAPGDFNGDNTVDLADHLLFSDCLTGPNTPPQPVATGASAEQCLIAFDAEDDGDVDLQDAANFMQSFSVPW